MQQYDDPVEVRRGEAEDPEQFLWRGRLWKVRSVLARWVADPAAGRQVWRVEAGRGNAAAVRVVDAVEPPGHGVFDLCFDQAVGRWQLVGCQDRGAW